MPHIDLNGAHIHFTDTGGDGDAIVFSHGLLFSGAMFDSQVAHFRKTHRCITFDHRGQGQSGVTQDGYDMDTLTADAAHLISYLGVGPCHFVGLSMGGFVGMRLAARRPELLKTLTLLNTSAGSEPVGNGPKYRMLNFVARWFGLSVVVGQVMPILFGQAFLRDQTRSDEKRHWAKAIAGRDRIGITRAVTGVIERENCQGFLAQITLPVGIGVGDGDVATVPQESESLHQMIKGSERVVFEGVGHSSSIEAPDLVNALIERTIQRQ